MANTGEVKPDHEATKWFVLAIVGTALYVSAAFGFVILAEVEPGSDAVLVEPAAVHGQEADDGDEAGGHEPARAHEGEGHGR